MSSSTSSGSPPWPRAVSVAVDGDRLRVSLKDGREISVPIQWFDWLAQATDEQRQDFEIIEGGAGISWNQLDEGLPVPWLFGLPENPPRPRRDTYVVDYRHDGRRWLAEVADFESATWAPTLSVAKREARWLLASLLDVEDLEAAGIKVIDDVHSPEAVKA